MLGIHLLNPHALHISIKASFSKSLSFQGKPRHVKQIMGLGWVSRKAEKYSLCIVCSVTYPQRQPVMRAPTQAGMLLILIFLLLQALPCQADRAHLVPPAKAPYTMRNPGEEGIVCR